MASTITKVRTNYFSVIDVDRFTDIINRCHSPGEIKIIKDEGRKDGSGQVGGCEKYGFLCHESIDGFITNHVHGDSVDGECFDGEYDIDTFYNALREILPNDEAIIITEISYEAMRSLAADCTVITRNGVKVISINDEGLKLARQMLGNPEYDTKLFY